MPKIKELKIAIFSDNFYPEIGGIQDSISALGKELSIAGNKINFYVAQYSSKDFAVANMPVKEIKLGNNVSIHRFSSWPLPTPTKQFRLVIPNGWRWRQLEKFNPDVIHVHTFLGLGLEALTSGYFLNKPVIGTNHFSITEYGCYYPKFCKEWFKNVSLKYIIWFYNHCDYVTAPAKFLLNEMVKEGLRQPHKMIGNQVNTDVFNRKYEKEKAKKLFKLSDNTIMFAGKLAKEKKIDVTIRAVELVKKEIKDINFAIAGHGSDRARLKKLAKDLHVEKEIKFMGTFDHGNLAKLYRASDIFVITSTTEVQSMVLMQAMACGLPAISVNWRTMPELINDKNGFLVKLDNHKELAEKIIYLLKNKEQRDRFGRGAYDFVQQFSAPRVAGVWEKLYREVIKNHAKRP